MYMVYSVKDCSTTCGPIVHMGPPLSNDCICALQAHIPMLFHSTPLRECYTSSNIYLQVPMVLTDWEFIETRTDVPPTAPNTAVAPVAPAPSRPVPIVEPPLTGTDMVSPSESDDTPAKRMRKPSYCIRDILDGHSTASYRSSDPVITPGIQLPTAVNQDVILEGEGSADWMMIAEATHEYALVAETSEVKAIEPRSLAEERRRPDWELWEKGILEELGY
jgi:hypothetical protein